MKNKVINAVLALAVLLLGITFMGTTGVQAAAGEVYIKGIDYETLTMKVYTNGNNVIYWSLDQKTWNELEGVASSDNKGNSGLVEPFYYVDISWATPTADVNYYLKGDTGDGTHVVSCKFPKQNSAFKATFEKISGTFTFKGREDEDFFYYRKNADANGWYKVYFEDSDTVDMSDGLTYAQFLEEVKRLRFKGAKLIIRLGQVAGDTATDKDPGKRPSKESTVNITKVAAAPSVKINISKLTLNTKQTMEYCKDVSSWDDPSQWTTCEKNMLIDDIDSSFVAGGKKGSDVVLYFRVAATDKKPASLISMVTVPGQDIAPVNGTNYTVQYSAQEDKVVVTFMNAESTPYEYCIEKPNADSFDIDTAKWSGVTKGKVLKLARKTYDGATIYVRYKGVNENASKKIELKLPSDYSSASIDFPVAGK